jgi:hypothetical protein
MGCELIILWGHRIIPAARILAVENNSITAMEQSVK